MNGVKNVPFVDLQSDYRELKPEIDMAIQSVLDTSAYILGKAVTAFEADFAEFCRVDHAVGVEIGEIRGGHRHRRTGHDTSQDRDVQQLFDRFLCCLYLLFQGGCAC